MIHSIATAAADPITARSLISNREAAPAPTPRRASGAGRITWIESARGLGILLVVAKHVVHGLTVNGLLAAAPLGALWDSRYYNPQMAMFFALSGMFAERFASRGGRILLRDKAVTLLYPYFVWGSVLAVVRMAVATAAGRRTPIEYLWELPVYPAMQFWFIYVLFFISFLYFVMRRVGLSPAAVVAVTLVFYGFRPWDDQNIQASTLPILRIFYYAPFYAVGALASLHLPRLHVEGVWRLSAVAAAGLGIVVACASINGLEYPSLAFQTVVTLCGIAGIVALSALVSRVPRLDFLRGIGRRSLEIYVLHIFMVEGLRPLLSGVLHIRNPMVHFVAAMALSIAGSLAVVRLFERWGFKYAFRLPKADKPATRLAPRVMAA